MVVAGDSPGYHNTQIEKKIAGLKGMKSLYSDVYYSQEQFWNIYNKERYDILKQKYDPKSCLKSLYEKVSER